MSFASTLVVSDIDDTLKASCSDSLKESIVFAPSIENELKGMSKVFKLIQDIEDVKFLYLSAAPEMIMQDLHYTFLEAHRFPKGKLKLKSIFDDTVEYKVRVIEKAVRKSKNIENLILIGDNGQQDALAYDLIAKKHADKLNVIQYIRQTYPPHIKKALKPFQTPFVSPLEICVGLSEEELIDCPDSFIQELLEDIESEQTSSPFGSYYFHPYMNCVGYKWPYSYKDEPLLNLAGLALERKCSFSF